VSHLKKIVFAGGMATAALAVLFFWPAPMPSYAGRTVEQWFDLYTDNGGNNSPAQITNVAPAFTAMGTKAVPYLAGRITQPEYSAFTRWHFRNRHRIPKLVEGLLPSLPRSTFTEGMNAAELLTVHIQPPRALLLPLLEPALHSTNLNQRIAAFAALRSKTPDFALAQPHLTRGLRDANSDVQKFAALAIRRQGADGQWALTNLLEASRSADPGTLGYLLYALNNLGTNALRALPELHRMLGAETNAARRDIIANSIHSISNSVP
jgi:hypothetical protein